METLSIFATTALPIFFTWSTGRPSSGVLHAIRDGLFAGEDPLNREVVQLMIANYESHFRKLPNLTWLADQDLPANAARCVMAKPHFRSSRLGVSSGRLLDLARYACRGAAQLR